eukprot:403340853
MHIIQSQQDSNTDSEDKEDWIAVGGHSQTTNIVGATSTQKAFMILFQYIAGLRWAYYDVTSTFASINQVRFAANGLEIVYLTTSPMHLLIFDTLSGRLKSAFKFPNKYDNTNFGLETRLQSSCGIFLAYQTFNGDQPRNLIVMEFNQTSQQTLWALNIGSYHAQTQLKDMAFTGTISDYERLYIAGKNSGTHNMIASIDTSNSGTSDIETFKRIYIQKTQNYDIKFISVYVRTLAICGDSSDTSNPLGHQKSYAAYGIVTQSTDVLTYTKDYVFDFTSVGTSGTASIGYCGGVFTDSKNMYVMIVTDKLSSYTGKQMACIYKKDIATTTNNQLKAISLTTQTSATIISHSFQVKSENNARTFFFAGSVNKLGSSVSITDRTSFIQKLQISSTTTTFTCIDNISPDPTISDLLTSEGLDNSFIGTTESTGLWFDSTSDTISGGTQRIKTFVQNTYDTCLASLSQYVIVGATPDDGIYYIGQSAKFYTFETFQMVLGSQLCTDVLFTFYAEQQSGEALPSFIQIDQINRIFRVQTVDSQDADIYYIKITGYSSVGQSAIIYWKLYVKQNTPPRLEKPLNNVKLYYDENKRIQLPKFLTDTGASVYISITLHDKLYLPSWIDYDSDERQIQIFPNNIQQIGEYQIDVVLTESIAFLTSTFTFTAYVIDKIYNITDSDKIAYYDTSVKVTNSGIAYITFSTKIANFANLTLSDKLMTLRIVGDAQFEDDDQIDDGVASPYQFDYQFLSFNSTTIKVQLSFDNPSQISLFQEPDYLQVQFRDNKTFFGQKFEIIRNTSMIVKGAIPRLIEYNGDQYNSAELIGKFTIWILFGLIIVNLVAWYFLNTKMTHMLRLILVLQIFEYSPLLKLNLPSMALKGLHEITYTCFQFIKNRTIYANLFDDKDMTPFNYRYLNQSIQSQNFLTNFGDILLISILLGFCFIIVNTIGRAFQNNFKITNFFNKSRLVLNQNLIFQFMQLTYLPIILLSTKTLVEYDDTSKYQVVVSHLKEQDFFQKYSALYINLNCDNKMTVIAHQIWFIRATLFAYIIVFMESYPKIQVSLLFSMCTLMQLYYMIYQPYKLAINNIIHTLNETAILINAVFYYFFTDMTMKIGAKIVVGWCLLWIYVVVIGLNAAYIMYLIVKNYRIKKGYIIDDELFTDKNSMNKENEDDQVKSFEEKEASKTGIEDLKKIKPQKSPKKMKGKGQFEDNVIKVADIFNENQSKNSSKKLTGSFKIDSNHYGSLKLDESRISETNSNQQDKDRIRKQYEDSDVVFEDVKMNLRNSKNYEQSQMEQSQQENKQDIFGVTLTKVEQRNSINYNEQITTNPQPTKKTLIRPQMTQKFDRYIHSNRSNDNQNLDQDEQTNQPIQFDIGNQLNDNPYQDRIQDDSKSKIKANPRTVKIKGNASQPSMFL